MSRPVRRAAPARPARRERRSISHHILDQGEPGNPNRAIAGGRQQALAAVTRGIELLGTSATSREQVLPVLATAAQRVRDTGNEQLTERLVDALGLLVGGRWHAAHEVLLDAQRALLPPAQEPPG